jgi:hypothetical protein
LYLRELQECPSLRSKTKPENKNNNKDKGDTTMNEKKNTLIQEEAEAIARKVVNNVMDKMAKLCVEKSSSHIDLIANTIASEEALSRSTFDVHIIIRPREDGTHIETSIRGHVSDEHSDGDEE